jgi:hypothetical protein
MDIELHRVPDAVGNVEEALLPSPIAAVDITHRSVRRLPQC